MPANSSRPLWSLADIPYGAIDLQKIAAETDWFYLLAGASFVEILSDLYTRNLVSYYAGDEEAIAWLETEWEMEEIQHGRALRQYVETVWPDFDWERAFAGFRQDYSPYCRPELLGPSRALEMAARCVVETGTSSFYAMIQAASPEPVLAQLASRIRNDEVHHYKYFYRFFRHYQEQENNSRWRIGRELWRRVAEVDQEDAYLAIKNVFQVRNSGLPFSHDDFEQFRGRMSVWVRRYYPFDMALKMLLKPVDLPPTLQKAALPLLTRGARRLVAA